MPGGVPIRNFPEFWPRTLGTGLDAPEPLTTMGYLGGSAIFYCPNYQSRIPSAGATDWSFSRRTSYVQFVNSYWTGNPSLLPNPYAWPSNEERRADTTYNVSPEDAMAQDICVDMAGDHIVASHDDGVNVVFTDGHGKYVRRDELADDHLSPVHWFTPGTWRMHKQRM